MAKLTSSEYAMLLQKRSNRVTEILKSEGFGSGLTFTEEAVEEAMINLQKILNAIKRKQKERRKTDKT